MTRDVGGEGIVSVGRAKRALEEGVQGILHVYPFKCMPEGLVRDALKELSRLYGARYLGISFNRETDIERLKTELQTFAALLKSDLVAAGVQQARDRQRFVRELARRRRALSRLLERLHLVVHRPHQVW